MGPPWSEAELLLTWAGAVLFRAIYCGGAAYTLSLNLTVTLTQGLTPTSELSEERRSWQCHSQCPYGTHPPTLSLSQVLLVLHGAGLEYRCRTSMSRPQMAVPHMCVPQMYNPNPNPNPNSGPGPDLGLTWPWP